MGWLEKAPFNRDQSRRTGCSCAWQRPIRSKLIDDDHLHCSALHSGADDQQRGERVSYVVEMTCHLSGYTERESVWKSGHRHKEGEREDCWNWSGSELWRKTMSCFYISVMSCGWTRDVPALNLERLKKKVFKEVFPRHESEEWRREKTQVGIEGKKRKRISIAQTNWSSMVMCLMDKHFFRRFRFKVWTLSMLASTPQIKISHILFVTLTGTQQSTARCQDPTVAFNSIKLHHISHTKIHELFPRGNSENDETRSVSQC